MSLQCSDSDEALNSNVLDDEDEWKDIEPDMEGPTFITLSGQGKFRNLEDFLEDCKAKHRADLPEIKNRLNLETFGMIKLVNYLRTQVMRGISHPDLSPSNFLDRDEYLKPVIADDALLYHLDDVEDYAEKSKQTLINGAEDKVLRNEYEVLYSKYRKLYEQAEYYRSALKTTYLEKLDLMEQSGSAGDAQSGTRGNIRTPENTMSDSYYFSSYGYNDIHETMLKDTVRTDAYRDFVYENKHLFKDKVVLDVGCGTGILSMFCAKAGASKVIAVDNSSIIDKAREIVFDNGLDNIIQCLRGRIEEVVLPVTKVDVIVSEWMGYCLLYEAMLDSVLWARDHYLTPDGLMVPSHATLRVAPFTDEDYIVDKVTFWSSVYGFRMRSMQHRIYEDIIIRPTQAEAIPATSSIALQVKMHSTTVDDLEVSRQSFSFFLDRDVEDLHGFVLYFDIFFGNNRYSAVPNAGYAKRSDFDGIAFTTGPAGPETHWQQALALINPSNWKSQTMKKGHQIAGEISIKKSPTNFRELELTLIWNVHDGSRSSAQVGPTGAQTWYMR